MAGSEPATPQSPIARRYGKAGEASWSHVLNHFALNEGFALVVLVVPDQDASDICSRKLARWLSERGKRLLDLSPGDPGGLREAASTLLGQPGASDLGCVWFGTTTAESDEDHFVWRDAWRWGLGTLNQQRNSLREHFDCTVVVAGPLWLLPLFREVAPDLWSIRSIVAWLETDFDVNLAGFLPETERRDDPLRLMSQRPIGDLNLALQEVDRLRGVLGQERFLADMLFRAGGSYAESGLYAQAEAMLREGYDYSKRFDDPHGIFTTLSLLALVIARQDRPHEAEVLFRQALLQAEQNDDSLIIRAAVKAELAMTISGLDRNGEAEVLFKDVLSSDLNFDDEVLRARAIGFLASIIVDQGRYAEAEELFRQALVISEDRRENALLRAILLRGLGGLMLKQRKFEEAESLFGQQLKLREEGNDSVYSRALASADLGVALAGQGRLSDARQLIVQAQALLDESGETSKSTETVKPRLDRLQYDLELLDRLQHDLEEIQPRFAEAGIDPASILPRHRRPRPARTRLRRPHL